MNSFVTPTVKVCFLDHCAQLSGGELALLRMIPALDNVESVVLLAEAGPLIAELEKAQVRVKVFPLSRRAAEMRKDKVGLLSSIQVAYQVVRYSVQLAIFMRRNGIDIVYTNSMKAHFYGALAAKIAHKKLIWHVRDRIAEDYLPARVARAIRVMARLLPNAIICNSQATLDALQLDSVGTVVPSPVVYDSATFPLEARAAKPDAEPLAIGIVGRISPWKGQHIFLEAAAKATKPGTQLYIIGSAMFGETEYEASLRQLVEDLGITDRTTFKGFVRDVPSALLELDILVHASTIPEPFGQVVVEGMAAGLAVVASNAGGPAEIIEDGVDGLLVPPGDVDALAAAIETLKLAETRGRLAANAQRTAENYRPERVGRAISAVLELVNA